MAESSLSYPVGSQQKRMQMMTFIKYLINSKGFVTIAGDVYRNGNVGRCGKRETFPYHVEDIGYKWSRYRRGDQITPEQLSTILEQLDIGLRQPEERKRIMEELE